MSLHKRNQLSIGSIAERQAQHSTWHAGQEMTVAEVAILGDKQHLVVINKGRDCGIRCLRAI
jgi:hypothetical protein